MFVSQATKDAQPLSRDEVCETILGKRTSYLKGLGWGSKPKSHKTTSASSSLTSCSESMAKLQLRFELDGAK
ncbi:zinc finger protein ZPR1-like protein [Cucumis melo var. makuwa]|uniref:Zinc finger protein ZPR1-like protein n=1 Tax=Cucumis melo var. makuwa TaxID=1194695 RepID=A0A5D3DMN7_CUCMM|nr:zinc finger protein ZPR1-like protein [Cucumis melo var. makuwa]TYK24887.1 zinc finger protein ZPR1-like protein [Cucumis melo var. makuwa]